LWRALRNLILHRQESRNPPSGRVSPDVPRRRHLSELESRIGHRFNDPGLLDQALTHKSFSHEAGNGTQTVVPHYESLEFLGDSILGFVISDSLYRSDPSLTEGELTKIRAQLVSTSQLATKSLRLGLGKYLRLSRGEEKTGGREKRAILADLFESLVASIYLDSGLEAVRRFIEEQFRPQTELLARGELELRDSKSSLQEELHRRGLPSPQYDVITESGPDHEKTFFIGVSVQGNVLAEGKGRSKKEAESKAAQKAIDQMGQLDMTENL